MTAESADKMIVDHRLQYPIRFTPQAVTSAKVAACGARKNGRNHVLT
jgi:hypothetical protein